MSNENTPEIEEVEPEEVDPQHPAAAADTDPKVEVWITDHHRVSMYYELVQEYGQERVDQAITQQAWPVQGNQVSFEEFLRQVITVAYDNQEQVFDGD